MCYISEGKTGNIITLQKLEEGNLVTETRNDVESSDDPDDGSIMPPILSKEEIYAIDSGDESDDDTISTEMLEDIHDWSQSHPNVNRREACYKICDRIKQKQSEWKGALKATWNMGKGLHKVFKNVVEEILQESPPLGESGS